MTIAETCDRLELALGWYAVAVMTGNRTVITCSRECLRALLELGQLQIETDKCGAGWHEREPHCARFVNIRKNVIEAVG